MKHNLFTTTMIFTVITLFIWLFLPFLKSFIVAFLLMTAFTPIQFYIEKRVRNSKKASLISASILTLTLLLVLFVPILFFIVYVASHPNELMHIGSNMAEQIGNVASSLPDSMSWITNHADMLENKLIENQEKIITFIALNFGNGLLGVLNILGEMLLIITIFFFLLWYRKTLILSIAPIIPLPRKITKEFSQDLITTTASGFYTLIGVALAQGIAFGLFIAFFNAYDPWLFGLLIAITSVVPLVGTALVFVPVALNEFFHGNSTNALIILIYSWAMLSFFIDNIVRLLILKQLNHYLSSERNSVDDFLIFFAIMAGLASFGFWGFLIGPAIVSTATTLVRVLKRYRRAGSLRS